MSEIKTGRAPGKPGAGPHWESGRKSGVGRACNFLSRVWFTVGDGILNEIYYPRPDQPCTKDGGFLVTDGRDFFSEERRDVDSKVEWHEPGVPALRIRNTHRGGLYRIEKEIIAHPQADVILQRTRFEVLRGKPEDYHLYFILAPHLGDEGCHNTASFGSSKGAPLLFAQSRHAALALACSTGWKGRSVGFVGASDGWQDISQHKRMLWHYDLAEEGNVAVTGEIHLEGESFILAIGFGDRESDAAYAARASLDQDFDQLWTQYVREWHDWQKSIKLPGSDTKAACIFRNSAAVLRVHEGSLEQPGSRVASLSIPWGEAREHQEAAGYHVVWARDCSQSALGLLACGAHEDVRRTLDYLRRSQEADGHWPQVMWCDGAAYWKAIQLDSIAAPVILYEIARQEGLFTGKDSISRQWPMVRRTAEFICRYGPVSEQDRWERHAGFSVYTLAQVIAALVIASRAADDNGCPALSTYLLETADAWNAQIENWTYFAGSRLAQDVGVPGFYCRVVPGDSAGRPNFDGKYSVTNSHQKSIRACEMISPDVWALVRYGLRSPDDPRVRNTTTAIDAILRVKTPDGPAWHRYNGDGYGETPEAEPFCGEGVGRAWPLLTGERGHYEFACGQTDEAQHLADAMACFADRFKLIPEQVWDQADIPAKGLFFGRATGSARPLAWAHAEYIQLLRSLHDGHVFSCPQIVLNRFAQGRTAPQFTVWRPDLQTPVLIPGTRLRIETSGPVTVKWEGCGRGQASSVQSPVGLYFTDLPLENIQNAQIQFSLISPSGNELAAANSIQVG